MNRSHRKTLATIFAEPISGNIEWRKVEGLPAQGHWIQAHLAPAAPGSRGHRTSAEISGKSLNKWATDVLDQAPVEQ